MSSNKLQKFKPCVIGLGYVGLPILLNLSKKYKTIGFDISVNRITELKKSYDKFGEFSKVKLKKIKTIYTSDLKKIKSCNIFIVTVPTPIQKNKKPDLSHIKDVCVKISKI